MKERLAALGVHLFTASGAALGALALERAIAADFPAMFGWLAIALFVDGVDGSLARMAHVREHAPWVDGETLDLVVDYLTYVVVPLAALWRAELMPAPVAAPALLIVASASALYFADKRMKTADHWFRGFPALWNVVVLYLLAFPAPDWAVALILAVLTALMFAPVRFVHPMRVAHLRVFTTAVGAIWCVCAALVIFDGLKGPWFARWGLVLAALYFLALPLTLRWRPARGRP